MKNNNKNLDLVGERFIYCNYVWEVEELFYTDTCITVNLNTHNTERFNSNFIRKLIDTFEDDKIRLNIDDSNISIYNNIWKNEKIIGGSIWG